MDTDDSFKRPGAVPFKWEIKPGIPKAEPPSTNNKLCTRPPQKLRPPPAGFYFSAPVDFATRSVRSTSRSRSERRFSHHPSTVQLRSVSVSPGCFPSPLLKRKVNKKNNYMANEIESDYASDLETLSRWSSSTQKSLSPFRDSPSSFSSVRSSPRTAGDAEWAAFGLF